GRQELRAGAAPGLHAHGGRLAGHHAGESADRRALPPLPRRGTVEARLRVAAPGETRRIPVRKEDVWTFTERNVSLWDLLDFFPADAVGPRGPADAPRPYEVKPITIETDLGWSFETDIQFGSW